MATSDQSINQEFLKWPK